MRTHELVMNWVQTELAAGRIQVGDRLPGERAIAESLGVARSAVREGLRVLEALGLVRSGVGSGPSAGTIVTAEPAQAMVLAFSMHLASGFLDAQQVKEARILLESWSVQRAAIEQQAGMLAEAEKLLDAMDDAALSVPEFLDLDAEFHVLISTGAGNSLISSMMQALRGSISEVTLQRSSVLPDWGQVRVVLQSEHRQLLRAIEQGRAKDAQEQVVAHINGYYELTSA